MKIGHFAIFSPNQSGMYATVKDLILSERSVGIDAQFIDYGLNQKAESREGLVDGDIHTVPLKWAYEEADVIIRHTEIPVDLLGKPALFALHGRPENSFRLEQYKLAPVISLVQREAQAGRYRGFFTFWPEHLHYWSWIMPSIKVHYIPSPINLDEFNPLGKKYDFGERSGKPNIVIADRWREDNTPFNIVYAAQYFREHFCNTAKVHIYGIPTDNTCINYLSPLQKVGLIGQTYGVVPNLAEIFRSADMLLTPNIIATRIIREAMASGLPVVAPRGCNYTNYTAEPRDYKAFAQAIEECYENTGEQERKRIRHQATREFGFEATGNAMKQMCEAAMGREVAKWDAMSIHGDDWGVLKDIVERYGIKEVVEFGSGISTELLAGIGVKVRSFETKESTINRMKDTPNTVFELWDGKEIPTIDSDMALIDGPHGGENRESSYRSVFESNIPIVACHDAHRAEDRKWIDKYFGTWNVIAEEPNTLRVLERP